jgi:membrane protease YdiL (CAAX protease family)
VSRRGAGPWPVLLAYVLAIVVILLFSLVAAAGVRAGYPDLPDTDLFDGLPGLLAGGLASSTALLLTAVAMSRPLTPAALRLLPGRETGRALLVMIIGMLALGQALDALLTLAGAADHGALALIRRALAGTTGPPLFAAVVVLGVLTGVAEEVFFRGYMQTRLGLVWSPRVAVAVTSASFAVLHLEFVYALLALALGLYLGFLTELSGSALPALVCHVLNNVLFTLTTAALAPLHGWPVNAALFMLALVVFSGCVVWLRRHLAGRAA